MSKGGSGETVCLQELGGMLRGAASIPGCDKRLIAGDTGTTHNDERFMLLAIAANNSKPLPMAVPC
jgi:hypothetical protein